MNDRLFHLFNQLTPNNKDYVLNFLESLIKSQDKFKDFDATSPSKTITEEVEINNLKLLLDLD
ncbi:MULTISPECIES: hypothetical protein [unclassified Lysinibacillus]|uniref:hypothetical protein n=1 Tax=unclassified Lysinibacillus TaxID=2636778 RepID=UPI0030F79D16